MNSKIQINTIKTILKDSSFTGFLSKEGLYPLYSQTVENLQINITRKCNLYCRHCHVDAGPSGMQEMSEEVLLTCYKIAALPEIKTIDITGGAPELHPQLPWFLKKITKLRKHIIIRSNLVILLEPDYRQYIELFAKNGIRLVTSLPDPDVARTDKQRGKGSFEKIIRSMRLLNDIGYGIDGSGLILDLAYNPAGAFLAGSQKTLEKEYKRKLILKHGVQFSKLLCLNNCPIGRFFDYLNSSDNLENYLKDLTHVFNPTAAKNVMCRSTLSVGWDGTLYDCDFNQMLSTPVHRNVPQTVFDFDLSKIINRRIIINDHCFSCTAGAGSSCQGATA